MARTDEPARTNATTVRKSVTVHVNSRSSATAQEIGLFRRFGERLVRSRVETTNRHVWCTRTRRLGSTQRRPAGVAALRRGTLARALSRSGVDTLNWRTTHAHANRQNARRLEVRSRMRAVWRSCRPRSNAGVLPANASMLAPQRACRL